MSITSSQSNGYLTYLLSTQSARVLYWENKDIVLKRKNNNKLFTSTMLSCLNNSIRIINFKVETNLDSILKSRDIILPTKVHIVKAMAFPVLDVRAGP